MTLEDVEDYIDHYNIRMTANKSEVYTTAEKFEPAPSCPGTNIPIGRAPGHVYHILLLHTITYKKKKRERERETK